MSFHAFEDYGIYRLGSTAAKSVPKQRTAADDWSRLSLAEQVEVLTIRKGAPYCRCLYVPCRCISQTALTYVRRHG